MKKNSTEKSLKIQPDTRNENFKLMMVLSVNKGENAFSSSITSISATMLQFVGNSLSFKKSSRKESFSNKINFLSTATLPSIRNPKYFFNSSEIFSHPAHNSKQFKNGIRIQKISDFFSLVSPPHYSRIDSQIFFGENLEEKKKRRRIWKSRYRLEYEKRNKIRDLDWITKKGNENKIQKSKSLIQVLKNLENWILSIIKNLKIDTGTLEEDSDEENKEIFEDGSSTFKDLSSIHFHSSSTTQIKGILDDFQSFKPNKNNFLLVLTHENDIIQILDQLELEKSHKYQKINENYIFPSYFMYWCNLFKLCSSSSNLNCNSLSSLLLSLNLPSIHEFESNLKYLKQNDLYDVVFDPFKKGIVETNLISRILMELWNNEFVFYHTNSILQLDNSWNGNQIKPTEQKPAFRFKLIHFPILKQTHNDANPNYLENQDHLPPKNKIEKGKGKRNAQKKNKKGQITIPAPVLATTLLTVPRDYNFFEVTEPIKKPKYSVLVKSKEFLDSKKRCSIPYGYFVVDLRSKEWQNLQSSKVGPINLSFLKQNLQAVSVDSLMKYSKVYPIMISHSTGEPTSNYFEWAYQGFAGHEEEYQRTFLDASTPLFSYWKNQKISELEKRRKLFIPYYFQNVQKTEEFKRLVTLYYEKNGKLILVDNYSHDLWSDDELNTLENIEKKEETEEKRIEKSKKKLFSSIYSTLKNEFCAVYVLCAMLEQIDLLEIPKIEEKIEKKTKNIENHLQTDPKTFSIKIQRKKKGINSPTSKKRSKKSTKRSNASTKSTQRTQRPQRKEHAKPWRINSRKTSRRGSPGKQKLLRQRKEKNDALELQLALEDLAQKKKKRKRKRKRKRKKKTRSRIC